MCLTIESAYGAPEKIRELFGEYMTVLLAGDPAFQDYLTVQGYDAEFQDPTVKYALPGGRLYLAYWNGALAGCIALRQIDERRCEIKRLYVRPAFRQKGIAKALVEQVIADARAIGYDCVLLDTLPFLTTAIDMYHRRGFYDIPRYNDCPLEHLLYMRLDL